VKLPRDLSGAELVRLSCETPSVHHITVPAHDPLKVGTLAAILTDVAAHHEMSRESLVHHLFDD
jgi:hypothetical protein